MEGRPTVTQLPEMLGEIFGWSKVLFDNELEAAANFLAFSQVCYTWRSTVHAMPRLWQVVSLGYWLVYDPNNDADPFYSNLSYQTEKLLHYARLSRNYPLAIRLVLPSLQPAVRIALGDRANIALNDCIWTIILELAEVSDRIDQLTVIAPSKQSMDYMSYHLNGQGNISYFDPTRLFLSARVVQFLYTDDIVSERPMTVVPSSLPTSAKELVLIRPIHQWWRTFFEEPQTPRFSACTSLVFQRPLVPFVSMDIDHHLLRLFSTVSKTLRRLELRDDTVFDPRKNKEVQERGLLSWDRIGLKLDSVTVVCKRERDIWLSCILAYLEFFPQGRLLLKMHDTDEQISDDLSQMLAH